MEGGYLLWLVDGDGQIVWEYINRYSEDEVLRISDAIRYSKDYFTQDAWTCNKKGF